MTIYETIIIERSLHVSPITGLVICNGTNCTNLCFIELIGLLIEGEHIKYHFVEELEKNPTFDESFEVKLQTLNHLKANAKRYIVYSTG